MANRRMPPKVELSLEGITLDTQAVIGRLPHYTGTTTYPLATPICHSATFRLDKVDDFLGVMTEGGQVYSRLGNVTTDTAECVINALEGGVGSLVYASGMGAISTVLIAFLKAGDHVIMQNPIYSNTLVIIKEFQEKYGIELTFVEAGCKVDEFAKQIKPNTKMLYGETPCNPNMTILDLEEFGKLGQSKGIITAVDSTFASCFIQQPIKHGVDISIQSCSKYLGGHSDLIGGSVTTRTLEQWKLLKKWTCTLGSTMAPQVASLLIRGIKTLPIRMVKHSQNAMKVAQYLENHPKIEVVHYPGLPSHPQHAVAKKQMTLFGGMVRADVKGGAEAGRTLVESLKIFQLAVSLGGVESLIEQPFLMTHGQYIMTPDETDGSQITPGCLRISVGIEDADDLIRDLEQALEKVTI